MSAVKAAPPVEDLLLRARAYGLCAQLLSESGGADGIGLLEELRQVLDRLGVSRKVPDSASLESLARSTAGIPHYLRPLLSGSVSPYETSYEPRPGMSGGQTFRLADIAGFYSAFGFAVAGERPDHIVPELEFVALLYAKEAYARISGQDEGAETCARARKAFLDEHLMSWLTQLSRSLAEQAPGSGLSALVATVLALGDNRAGGQHKPPL